LFHPKALLPSSFFPPILGFLALVNFLLFDLHSHIWETLKIRFFWVSRDSLSSLASLFFHFQN
jgi:hypothetical protein